MGTHAERVAISDDVSRADQDAFALTIAPAGHRGDRRGPVRCRDGAGDGPRREGPRDDRDVDEGPRRDSTIEALARLKPAFALPEGEDRGSATVGTVTAGNAPGITDGAAATVVASEREVERLGLTPLARIVGYAQAEVEPKWLFLAPIEGVRRLLDRIELPIEAFDLVEINEAFAAQTLADGRALGFDWDKVNVNGGAIALGHPIGASGARIVATLLHELGAARAATASRRCASAAAARSRWPSSGSDRGRRPVYDAAMTETAVETPTFRHFIAGEWVRLHVRRDLREPQPGRHAATSSGASSRGPRPTSAMAIKAAETAFPMWRRTPAPKRGEILYAFGALMAAAQGTAGPGDDPRDGQGHRRGARRRPGRHRHRLPDGRRGPADGRRHGPVRAPRQVGDEHPPAARRGRHHHALELPDGDPVLEDDAGAGHRQHRRLQALVATRPIARRCSSS